VTIQNKTAPTGTEDHYQDQTNWRLFFKNPYKDLHKKEDDETGGRGRGRRTKYMIFDKHYL
jgi:hypothetical protein